MGEGQLEGGYHLLGAPPPLCPLDSRQQRIYTVNMDELRFEWDERKNRDNQRKHGVSFEEASTVFFDESATEFYDDEHSTWEDRFLMLGLSAKLRVLLVCHCLRESSSVIRIVSARKATKNERTLYPGGRR